MWKCKNKKCGKTFEIPARMTVKKPSKEWAGDPIIIEMACCPFCYSIDFEEVKETAK